MRFMYMRFMYIEESLPIDVYQTLASHHYRHMINTNKKEENFTLSRTLGNIRNT